MRKQDPATQEQNDDEDEHPNVREFREALTQKLTSAFQHLNATNPSVLATGMHRLFQELEIKKQPTLPADVVAAVSTYTTEEHKHCFHQWYSTTTDKNAIDINGNTVLHYAALHGRLSLVTWMLSKNCFEINATNEKSDSPLICTINEAGKHRTTNNPIRKKLLEIISKLIIAGATNCPQKNNILPSKSAMCAASIHDDIEVVKLLLNHHFDINEGDIATPLFWAESKSERNQEMINFLKENGAISGGARRIPTNSNNSK